MNFINFTLTLWGWAFSYFVLVDISGFGEWFHVHFVYIISNLTDITHFPSDRILIEHKKHPGLTSVFLIVLSLKATYMFSTRIRILVLSMLPCHYGYVIWSLGTSSIKQKFEPYSSVWYFEFVAIPENMNCGAYIWRPWNEIKIK